MLGPIGETRPQTEKNLNPQISPLDPLHSSNNPQAPRASYPQDI